MSPLPRGNLPAIVNEYYTLTRPPVGGASPPPGRLEGRATLRLETLTPLHVGSGLIGASPGGNLFALCRNSGEPVIPGSSLKGVLRSTAEALSASCIDFKCRSCWACSIFGALGFRGPLSIGESRATEPIRTGTEGIPARWSHRRNRPLSDIRFYNHLKSVRKGDELLEVVPAGTVFRVPMTFRDFSGEKLGLVLLASGADDRHTFLQKVGGGKAQGLGSVRIQVESLTLRTIAPRPPVLRDTDAGGRRAEFVDAYFACQPLPIRQAIETNLRLLGERSQALGK